MFKKIICVILCLAFCLLTGCSKVEVDILKKNDEKIANIAYNEIEAKTSDDYTVMISENGILVPYLVIESIYNGGTLLLRKEPLDVPMAVTSTYGSYFHTSDLNNYLNTKYLETINEDVRSAINNTLIGVTKEESIGNSGTYTEVVETKVFLLSVSELHMETSNTISHESAGISYFTKPENMIAYKNGTAVSWWTRTPNTKYKSVVCGVDAEGKLNFGNATDKNFVRPAFCISPSTKVYKHQTGENSFFWMFSSDKR